jgi:hypothetical protein
MAWVVWNATQKNFFRYPDGRPVLLTKERAEANADAWSQWPDFGKCRAVPWDEQAQRISEGGGV